MNSQILILGATSAIAQAYARLRAADHCAFVLLGRNAERLDVIAADLKIRGARSVDTMALDLADINTIAHSAADLHARYGDAVQEIVIAYGVLGDQSSAERDLVTARGVIDTNFTSAALWLLALLKNRTATTPLTFVVISSVAGDRGRASNFVYGATKGALSIFVEGLAQKYADTPIRFVTVKPGFVDTPMTDAVVKKGPLWASPEKVAADIHRSVARGRRAVYTPWFWGPIMLVIRHLPWFVFRKLKI